MALYDDYFEDDYLLLEEPTDVETLGHIAFLRSVLPGCTQARVLDLACGSGRLSLAMARLGWRVTALDFKESMLRRGREMAEKAGLAIDFILQDMRRKLNYEAEFDFVLSFLRLVWLLPR